MSREIKFRAWLKDAKCFAEIRHISFFEGKTVVKIYDQPMDIEVWFELEELEIMQYTGLKDKNDVEIYEGDIVTYVSVYKWNKKLQKSVVTFSNGMFNPGSVIGWGKDGTCEVIGNIYSNPEQLEASK